MAEVDKAGAFSDEELEDLFSSFGEVSAPESLKASTLEFIAALPGTAGVGSAAAPTQSAPDSEPAAAQPASTAAVGGKVLRLRSRARGFRIAAVAACLTLVVTGGTAYAMPVSIVTITQGDASVELGVNLFGMSVSATSDDEGGRSIIDSNNLIHVSYGDALSRVAGAFDAVGGGELELAVQSPLGMQLEQLERHNQAFLSDRDNSTAQQNGHDETGVRPSRGSSRVADSAVSHPVGDDSDGSLPGDGVLPGGSLASYEQPSSGGQASIPVAPTPPDPTGPSDGEGSSDPDGSDPHGPDPVDPDNPDNPDNQDSAFSWVIVDDESEPGDPSDGEDGLPGEDDHLYDFSPISSDFDPSPIPDPIPDPDPMPVAPDPPIILINLEQADSAEVSQGPDQNLAGESAQDQVEELAPQIPQGPAE